MIANDITNFHWMQGVDFKSLIILSSPYASKNDAPTIARFNNT